ncbi:MAG TPA: sulfatase [Candidatus Hydrogenedentes bacterium]|nr:sulfatase [Candidatus Hydrogenedentota bacterium]HPG67790.1 sulfatase [Candidatus Hydrogenedentota bacterium]
MAVYAVGEEAASPEAAGRPNVIWILLDACRARNLSCYGYTRETSPHIDQLAADGTVFLRHCTQAGMTVLSVPSFLTGRYFPVCSLAPVNWRAQSRVRPPNEKYVSETLAENGYVTAVFTAHPGISSKSKLREAFQEYYLIRPAQGRSYGEFDVINARLLPWLEQRADKPFFAYVHSLDTHGPHYVHDGHDRWVDRTKRHDWVFDSIESERTPVSLDDPIGKEYVRGAYDGSIHFADAAVGEIAAKLKELGVYENTMLIISSDHGELIGEDGVNVEHPSAITTQELVHVPLVMTGPGIPKGQRVSPLTENADIVPSLLELMGASSNAQYDGKSFVPLLRDPKAKALHDYIVFKSRYSFFNEDELTIFAIFDGEYTYEFNPHTQSRHLWAMPDSIVKRCDMIDEKPDRAEKMHRVIEETLMPKWEDYARLPRQTPEEFVEFLVEAADKGNLRPETAWTTSADGSALDNKWLLSGRNLVAEPWSETVPPLSVSLDIPNGVYNVQMTLLLNVKGEHVSSAVQVTLQNESTPIEVCPGPSDLAGAQQGASSWVYINVARCTVRDGRFQATIQSADTAHWASARSFRFVLVEALGAAPIVERQAVEEQLQALGYLQ